MESSFGDTARFLAIGDAVWAEVFMVDAAGSHQITLKKTIVENCTLEL